MGTQRIKGETIQYAGDWNDLVETVPDVLHRTDRVMALLVEWFQ